MSALDDLVTLLDLEAIEVNIFRGISPPSEQQRVFGGQVAGQALVAASRTVDDRDRRVHSLHAYFLRPGDPTAPILYDVDRIRDGKSFTTRRVVAIQHGKAIFNLQASFHIPEDGPDYQPPMSGGIFGEPAVQQPSGTPRLTEEQWKASKNYRPEIPYDPGMTEARAEFLKQQSSLPPGTVIFIHSITFVLL